MSEGGERPKDEGGKDIPEVEAELVEETAARADAFDDAAPAGAPPQDSEPDATAPRKSTLTPGVVLFILFALAALGVLAYWRFQERPEAIEQPLSPAPESQPESPPASSPPPVETPAPDEPQPEAEAMADKQEAGGKIANTAPGDMKRSDPPFAGSTADAARPEGFLPPVGASQKLSNALEDGAKEAMQEFQNEADAAGPAPSPADDPSTDSIDGFEIEAPAPDATEDPAADAALDDEMGPADADTLAAPGPAPADNSAAIAALEEQFAAEARRLEAALEDERRRNADQATEITSLRADLSAALAARDQAVEEERALMRAEIEKIRNEDVKVSTEHMKASFALAALTRAVDQGDPYTEELAAMTQFERAAEAALGGRAQTGVPTEAALRERFPAAARAALAAAGQEQAGGGVSGLMARAASVISVRPASPQAGDSPGAVLSRAEHALGEGETGFALLQLEDLPMSAQAAMADWVADARARAEAEAALATLQARLAGEQE